MHKLYDKEQYRRLIHSAVPVKTRLNSLQHAFNSTALLVIDVQQFFCAPDSIERTNRGDEKTEEVARKIQTIVPEFRKASIPVFAVYYGLSKYDDPEFHIFKPEKSDIQIRKPWYSAFFHTDMKEQLQSRGITNVLLCGFNHASCVSDSAYDAKKYKFKTFVLNDICGNDIENRAQEEYRHEINARMLKDGINVITAHNFLKHVKQPKW